MLQASIIILVGCSSSKKVEYEIVQINTPLGEILIWLHEETPNHKNSFIQLAIGIHLHLIE